LDHLKRIQIKPAVEKQVNMTSTALIAKILAPAGPAVMPFRAFPRKRFRSPGGR
jgi:hypothetical protein